MENQVVEFDVTEAAISKMEDLYMKLIVKDVNDEKGFQEVHDARMVVKGHRVAVEKRRKELKADALAWGRKVDTEAKKIFSKLEPIENHLQEQERIVTDEKKRIQEAEAKALQEKIDNRMNELTGYNAPLPYQEVAMMSDDKYAEVLEYAKKSWEDEKEKLEKEKAEREAEEKRLEAIRKEQEKKEAEIREQQERAERELAAKQAKIEAELAAKQAEFEAKERAMQAEKDRIAAEEKAKRDEIERVEREKKEAEERKMAEQVEKERQEDLKPDKEKLIDWMNGFGKNLNPDLKLKTNEAKSFFKEAHIYFSDAIEGYMDEICML